MTRVSVADRLCGWFVRVMRAATPARDRDWLLALEGEVTAVPRGCPRVAWLVGGMRFALTLRTEVLVQALTRSSRASSLGRHATVLLFFLASWIVGVHALPDAFDLSSADRDRVVVPIIATALVATLVVAVWQRARWAVFVLIGLVVQGAHVALVSAGRPELQGWDGMMAPFFAATSGATVVLVTRARERFARSAGALWPLAGAAAAMLAAEVIAHRNLFAGVLPFRTPWMHLVVAGAAAAGVGFAFLVRARLDRSPAVVHRE